MVSMMIVWICFSVPEFKSLEFPSNTQKTVAHKFCPLPKKVKRKKIFFFLSRWAVKEVGKSSVRFALGDTFWPDPYLKKLVSNVL